MPTIDRRAMKAATARFLALVLAAAPTAGSGAEDDLRISVDCEGVQPCRHRGGDLRFRVILTNPGAVAVAVPLACLRKAGPIVRLTAAGSGEGTYLRRSLAEENLRRQFETIAPGRSASVDWIITESELAGVGATAPVRAEVTVLTEVRRGGVVRDFRASGTLHILSR